MNKDNKLKYKGDKVLEEVKIDNTDLVRIYIHGKGYFIVNEETLK